MKKATIIARHINGERIGAKKEPPEPSSSGAEEHSDAGSGRAATESPSTGCQKGLVAGSGQVARDEQLLSKQQTPSVVLPKKKQQQTLLAEDTSASLAENSSSGKECIQPTSLRRQSDVDHRCGIPGAFGVGETSPWLTDTLASGAEESQGSIVVSPTPEVSGEVSNHGLVTAEPIMDESSGRYANLQQASPQQTTMEKQTSKTTIFWMRSMAAVFLILLVSGVVTGILVSVRQSGVDFPVTFPPTSERSALFEAFEKEITAAMGSGYFANRNPTLVEARTKALDWIVYEDPLQLELGATNLLQRYILALFYYQTSINHPWKDCNPPSGTQGSNCFYTYLYYEEELYGTRWLSEAPECQWAGVLCTEEKPRVVSRIELGKNDLNGALPTELSRLDSLSQLKLPGNALTGELPADLPQTLKLLVLGGNQLVGTIPEMMFEPKAALDQLHLEDNMLTGPVPAAIKNFNGTWVQLESNQLTGAIPFEIFDATNLKVLLLSSNELTGTLHSEIGSLRGLENLGLEYTRLVGSLPSELFLLSQLGRLAVSNTGLEGTLPEALYGLTQLYSLELDNCAFSGTLSTKIGFLTDLRKFRVANNNLNGNLPSQVSLLKRLYHLSINGNSFTGSELEAYCEEAYVNYVHERFFSADCITTEETGSPAIECSCCTECCDAGRGICLPV